MKSFYANIGSACRCRPIFVCPDLASVCTVFCMKCAIVCPAPSFRCCAVGSFSRPCKVDPQSRIVVYAPESQLDTMPLPFLARFEKYRVSVDDLLAETLLTLGERDRESGNPCDRAGLLRMVQAGCEHFVEWMDPAR